jgi:hypothetical protein
MPRLFKTLPATMAATPANRAISGNFSRPLSEAQPAIAVALCPRGFPFARPVLAGFSGAVTMIYPSHPGRLVLQSAALLVVFYFWLVVPAVAAAPGEDPISISGFKPTAPGSGSGQGTVKGGLDPNDAVPAWLRAKTTRYTARAYAENNQGINTDNQVVQSAQSNGMSKTCVQEVGSNTAAPGAPRFGPKGQQQIVVLRGDLVNICK